MIRERTGLKLSPYFSAAKIAWILENVEGAREWQSREDCVTEPWTVFWYTGLPVIGHIRRIIPTRQEPSFLTSGHLPGTKISVMFLEFRLRICCVTDSNGYYGETDFEGFLDKPVPIHGVLGDSHGALFGQGCLEPGMVKATYGTGSSVMMNVGNTPVFSSHGVVSSWPGEWTGRSITCWREISTIPEL